MQSSTARSDPVTPGGRPTDPLLVAPDASTTSLPAHNTEDDAEEEQLSYKRAAVLLVFLVPAVGGFLFGFDISATSYTVLALAKDVSNHAVLLGLVVAAASMGAFLGSLVIFRVADQVGRKRELQWAAILYMVGAVLEAGAGVWMPGGRHGNNTAWCNFLALFLLLLGRLVYGVGIACAMHGGPTYIAEMAPPAVRGLLVSLKEAVIVLGILTGYSVGYFTSRIPNGWMYAYGSTLVVSSTMGMLTWFLPRSCRWLLLQEREEEALTSLQFVFAEDCALQQFETMKEQIRDQNHYRTVEREIETDPPLVVNAPPQPTKSIWVDEYKGPMIAGIGLVVLQQVTGQPSILSYATSIFRDAGLSDYASIFVAIFKLVATLSAAALVERYGRKTLLYTGISFMLLALLTLTVLFGSNDGDGRDDDGSDSSSGQQQQQLLVLGAVFVYIGGYQVSFGPISWLMVSEVFPLAVRGQAVAVAVQMNFLCNAVVQFAVPVLQEWIGLNATFGMFAILTCYSIYFVKTKVPETKGLTLEEIEQQFRSTRRRSIRY